MLKVITLNCQRAYQKGCKDFLQQLLHSQEYDFILLQEANAAVHETVLTNLRNYNILFTHNTSTNSKHEICLIYRLEYTLIKEEFLNFYNPERKMLTQSGAAIGLFKLPQDKIQSLQKEYVLIGSLHLQASYHAKMRQVELRKIKAIFGGISDGYDAIKILGGDFNNLGPGEIYFHSLVLKPHLVYASHFNDHTHDTTLLEPMNRERPLAKLLLIDKYRYRVKLDHYFTDQESYDLYTIESDTLKVDVSDHRPVVMTLRYDAM